MGQKQISNDKQLDFVELLQTYQDITAGLYTRVLGDRNIEVLVPFGNDRFAHYTLMKDNRDDFIRLRHGSVSTLEPLDTNMGAVGLIPKKLFEVMEPSSHKEFALSVAPAGSDYGQQWFAEHNATGTVFGVSQQIYFDETLIDDWTPEPALRQVTTVKIVQHLLGKHTSDPANPLADIQTVHTVSAQGVHVNVKITWLRDVAITAGYGMMLPVCRPFADKLVTSYGNVYDATADDGSFTDLTENDQAISYAFIHTADGTNDETNTVLSMTIHHIEQTFRYNEAGRRNGSIVWLQHRNKAMQKLYPQVYSRHTVNAGERYELEATFFIGGCPGGLLNGIAQLTE